METSRLSRGEMIAAVSGLLLFLFMFFEWYGIDVEGPAGVGESLGGGNAWEWFSFIDILLFLAAATAVTLAVLKATGNMPALPRSAAEIVFIAGLVAVALIVFRLIVTPDDFESLGGGEVDTTRSIGIFLGLLAAAGIAYGGYTARKESGSITPRSTGARTEPPASAPPPTSGTPGSGSPPSGGTPA